MDLILEQIESLEMVIDNQAKKLSKAEYYLKRLAEIETNFSTFGFLSFEEQVDKQLILQKFQ